MSRGSTGRLLERVTEELGVDVAIETRNLARELQLDKPLAPTGAPAATSIEGSDGFIGRDAELAELQALLADTQCRLITVTGPGGMGKSRLVKELLHRRRHVLKRRSAGSRLTT